jgi:hypothetical protein
MMFGCDTRNESAKQIPAATEFNPLTSASIRSLQGQQVYVPVYKNLYLSEKGHVPLKSMGQVATSGAYHNIAFKYTVATRYLKYQMIEVPSRVDITKFYIYTAN